MEVRGRGSREGSWVRPQRSLGGSREIVHLVGFCEVFLLQSRPGLDWFGRRGGRCGALTNVAHHLLGLSRIVSDILLGCLGSTGSVVSGKLLDLAGLLVGNIGSLVEVVVNELLVGLVDEGSKEQNGGSDKREAPEWNDLDQIV